MNAKECRFSWDELPLVFKMSSYEEDRIYKLKWIDENLNYLLNHLLEMMMCEWDLDSFDSIGETVEFIYAELLNEDSPVWDWVIDYEEDLKRKWYDVRIDTTPFIMHMNIDIVCDSYKDLLLVKAFKESYPYIQKEEYLRERVLKHIKDAIARLDKEADERAEEHRIERNKQLMRGIV